MQERSLPRTDPATQNGQKVQNEGEAICIIGSTVLCKAMKPKYGQPNLSCVINRRLLEVPFPVVRSQTEIIDNAWYDHFPVNQQIISHDSTAWLF